MVSSDELQLIVSLSQALFSLGLLVVTAVYTYYTRQQSAATRNQIGAMEAQTEASAKPYLKPTIERPDVAECNFVIQNTGNGAAHDVSASWWIGQDENKDEWGVPLLPVSRKQKFLLRGPNEQDTLPTERDIKEAYEEEGYTLRFEASCEDIFGNSHEFEEVIDLEEAIWGREENATELLNRPPEETIAEGIDTISGNFRDIGNVAVQLRRELPSILSAYKTEQTISHLEHFGEISVDVLANLSPEDKHLVVMKMRDLAEDDLVDFDEEAGVVRLSDDDSAFEK